MIGKAAIKFESLTKYNLVEYIDACSTFFKTGFPAMVDFFNGNTDKISSQYLNEHKRLLKEADNISEQFKSNAEKLETADFWWLLEYCDDLRTKLQTATKISKYLRSSRVDFNFSKGFAHPYSLSDQQTFENVADSILEDSDYENTWTKIALSNDLKEVDYDADGGKNITLYREKFIQNTVTSVIDNMVGENIYGIDLLKKITFSDNDLSVVKYEECVYQCVDIMSKLKKGDIPEFPFLGVNSALYVGSNIANLAYSVIVRELTKVFQTDDLFIDFNVTEISLNQDSYFIKFDVGTKYKLIIDSTTVI